MHHPIFAFWDIFNVHLWLSMHVVTDVGNCCLPDDHVPLFLILDSVFQYVYSRVVLIRDMLNSKYQK